ncbi:MAG: ribonuclease catalytic domain-containing protein [Desulfovermiculus sp.]|nr:ribonuclease catalytic domain-containing protein [Desulfovermiculus sp.]
MLEYLQDNQPIVGWVIEESGKHLRILNVNKRVVKLSQGRVLPWVGPVLPAKSSRQEILDLLEALHKRRLDLQAEIDAVELWELTYPEVEAGSVDWLAGLIWSNPDPDHMAALGRVLLQHKAYFKFQPPKFIIYDPVKVETNLAAAEANRRRQMIVSQGQEFFKGLWKHISSSRAPKPPEPDPEVAEELKDIVLRGMADPDHKQMTGLWSEACRGLPEHEHLPLLLAQAWGLVPEHYNVLLDQIGYAWGDAWSAKYAAEIARQQELWSSLHSTPEELSFVSIDSATTQDMDDAFCLEVEESGNFKLSLALAWPGLTWDFTSDLDAEVAQRMSSLYLPEGTAHLLPESLGIKLYSLRAGHDAPAFVVQMILDPSGRILDTDVRNTWVRIRDNLTYSRAEELLATTPETYNLGRAYDLATVLRDHRIQQGAVILEQADPVLSLHTENNQTVVHLEPPADTPKAQLIVSEFMILVNAAMAEWARQHGLGLIHRIQDIRLPKNLAGIWTDPAGIYEAMRSLNSSKLDIEPHSHASLGLPAYAPVSSALRRYPDLMNLSQLTAFLDNGRPMWTEEELKGMLPGLSARMQDVTKVQRYRTRYWKLLYFQRWCKEKRWSGVVVAEEGQQVVVCLPGEQLFLRGPKHLFGDKVIPGARYRLELGKIDPLNNDIKIIKAREEE